MKTLPRQSAFTLIEILVAISLLAILGVLGYRGLDNVHRASARLTAIAERWQAVALATDRFGRDVHQALAIPGRAGDARAAPVWQTRRVLENRPDSAQLVFARVGVAGGPLQRVAYRWEAAADGTTEGAMLSLLLWPTLDAALPTRSYPLLAGVAGMELSYLDRHGNWQTDWREPRQLPRAVRIALRLAEGGIIERIFDVPAAE